MATAIKKMYTIHEDSTYIYLLKRVWDIIYKFCICNIFKATLSWVLRYPCNLLKMLTLNFQSLIQLGIYFRGFKPIIDNQKNIKVCTLLGYYAACSGNFHYMLHNNLEECSSHLLHGGNLKSHRKNSVAQKHYYPWILYQTTNCDDIQDNELDCTEIPFCDL